MGSEKDRKRVGPVSLFDLDGKEADGMVCSEGRAFSDGCLGGKKPWRDLLGWYRERTVLSLLAQPARSRYYNALYNLPSEELCLSTRCCVQDRFGIA